MSEIDDICNQINYLSAKLQEKINDKLLELEEKKNVSSEQNIIQSLPPAVPVPAVPAVPAAPAGVRIYRWDLAMINWTNSLRNPPFY